MTHVPYKGAAPAVTGLLGGEIDVAMVDLLNVLPHLSTGTLKVLAVASPSRAPQIPDVPTTKEAGFPAVVMAPTYGVIAAQGAADVQKKFRDAIVATCSRPRSEQLLKQGVIAVTATAGIQALIQAESDKWHSVIPKGKITLE